MTSPDPGRQARDEPPRDDGRPRGAGARPARRRSGTEIVVGMLVVIVLIIWSFDLVVSSFGPPEPAMQVGVESAWPGGVRVLVYGERDPRWSLLLDELAPGAEERAHLLAAGHGVWTLAVQFLDAAGPPPVLLDLRADPQRRVALAVGADGAVALRAGDAGLPLARQHLLAAQPASSWPVLRPRELLPELPPPGVEPPPAPSAWVFGRPPREAVEGG